MKLNLFNATASVLSAAISIAWIQHKGVLADENPTRGGVIRGGAEGRLAVNPTFNNNKLPFPNKVVNRELETNADYPNIVFCSSVANYGVQMLTNNNGVLDTSFTDLQTASFSNPYSIVFADVDGDGDKDIIASGYYNGPYILKYNSATGYTYDRALVHPGKNGGFDALRTADFDLDGRPDILLGTESLSNNGYLFWNDASDSWSKYSLPAGSDVYTRSLDVGDLNNDGHPDIVMVAKSNNPKVLLYNGGSTRTFSLQASTSVPLVQTATDAYVRLIHIDSDGHLDLLYAEDGKGVKFFLGNGDGTFQDPVTVPPPLFSSPTAGRYLIHPGDFNNDGKMDFLWLVRDTTGQLVNDMDQYIYLNNGGSFNLTGTIQSNAMDSHAAAIGDINNDGNVDIIIDHFRSGARPRLFLGNGDGTFQSHTNLPEQARGHGVAMDYDVSVHSSAANGTGSPTNATTTHWSIVFHNMTADFIADSDKELVMIYQISRGRTFKHTLYAGGCANLTTITGLAAGIDYNVTNGTTMGQGGMDTLQLDYSFNKAKIASSNIWDSSSDNIELCQVVELIEQSTDLGEMIIVSDKRNVTIDFNLTASFNLDIDLKEAALTSANTSTSVQDYLTAYQCNESFENDTSPLVANGQLFVCIKSSSTDVEIERIDSMTIKQGTVDPVRLPVIVNSLVQYSAITEVTAVSTILHVVLTRVPTNVFSFADDQGINIVGSLTTRLIGSVGSGRMLQEDIASADGTEVAISFDVKVALQPEPEVVMMNSAKRIAGKGFAIMIMTVGITYALGS